MTRKLTQKSEEIRKYQTEQAVVLSRVRELVGHPGEVVNKAHLYDQLMESADPSSARQTLQILVKYSRSMKDLLKEIQKLLPPSGTPRRVLYPGPLGSPTCTLYEVIGEIELVPASQAGVGPSQPAGTSQPPESGRFSDREKSHVPEWTRSSQVRRKSTEQSTRSRRGQSPNPNRGRTSDHSRTPERARTPAMMRTPDRGKAPMSQASPAPAPDCVIMEHWAPPPSHAISARDPRTTSVSCGRNRDRTTGSDPSPVQSSRKEKKASGTSRSGSRDGPGEDPSAAGNSEEEIAPSPNMRRVFTRL